MLHIEKEFYGEEEGYFPYEASGVTGTFKEVLYFAHSKMEELSGCKLDYVDFEIRSSEDFDEDIEKCCVIRVTPSERKSNDFVGIVICYVDKEFEALMEEHMKYRLRIIDYNLRAKVRMMKIDALTDSEQSTTELVQELLDHIPERKRRELVKLDILLKAIED